ncbi:MAG: ATP synthase F0 subunit B [Candidatus Aminicenantales bacterium]
MLSIDSSALFVFLIVWVLVFILTKVFFNPVRKVRDERERRVRRGLDESRRSQEEYEQSREKINRAVREAKLQAEQVRERLTAEASREKSRMVAEMNAEYRRRVEAAKSEVAAQVGALIKDADFRADDLAERIERRLLD